MAGGLAGTVEVTALGLAGLANMAVAWRGRREEGLAVGPFVAMAVGIGVLALAAAVVRALTAPTSVLWGMTVTVFMFTCPIFYGVFVIGYTGYPEYYQGWRAGLLMLPPAALVVLGSALALRFGGITTAAQEASGATAVLLTLVWVLVLLATFGIVAVMLRRIVAAVQNTERFDRRLGTLVLVAGLAPLFVPWIGGSLASGLGESSVEPSLLVVGALVPAGANWLAVERYDLFESSPAPASVGAETLVETMEDAAVVVDREGTIVECNPAASRTFATGDDVVSRPLEAVVGADLAAVRRQGVLSVDTADGRREYEPSVAAIEKGGYTVGHTVVFRDVTEQRTRRQRLAVLNRVLRHDLRNDVTAITGYSELIADGRPEPSEIAERITETAQNLAATGEKARAVEHLMSEPRTSDAGVELASVVENVADRFRETHPGATVRTAVPDVVLDLNESILDRILAQLVENAIEHHDGDPIVEITATVDPERAHPLAVSVADDGPGIPERERAVITEGRASPLQRGSGLGLWVVSWGVSRLGGVVEFTKNDPRGSVVTVRLPEQPASGGTDSPTAEESAETPAVIE